MLTLQDVVRTAEAQRRFPNWILWLLGVVFAAWAIGSMVDAFPWQRSGNVPAVQPGQQTQIGPAVENPPVQDPAPKVTVPATPEVELAFVNVGSARVGTRGNIQYPSERFFFMPGPTVKTELNFFTEHSHAYGDGTAFLVVADPTPYVYGPDGDEELFFTPNKGVTWFKVRNPYPGESIAPVDTRGALLEGNTLVLYLVLEPEPLVETYWRAETSLSELKKLR